MPALQHALHSSPDADERTRLILEHSFDAFFAVDSANLISDWGDRAEAMLLFSREEAIGHSAQILIPERHRQAFSSDVQDIIARGDAYVLDKPLRMRTARKDGYEISAEAVLIPRRKNGVYRLEVFIRDLTERRRLEAALSEVENHREILNFIDEAFLEIDLRGNHLFVNDAYCRILGRSREEVLSPAYQQLVQTGLATNLRDVYQNVFKTGEPLRGFQYESEPGRFMESTIGLKRNASGKPTGFVTISRDITERRRQEEEMARAKEAAEAANKAKSDFLANMSHEIRTPMNGILGMTELALGTELNAEQRDFLTTAWSSAESLLVILNDILDYSKIEAGKIRLDPIDFNLEDCLSDAMRSLAVTAHKKGLELVYHFTPDTPLDLRGDTTRLRQVLLNLVGNAIKFTATGEIALEVKTQERFQNDDSLLLQFSVSDTGIGIPLEKQASLFQVFEQADSSTTRKYGGTGLGLAISKRIVELMGGKIWVESAAGVGSTFHFTVPFQLSSSPARVEPASLEDLNALRVLVIDDNGTNRRILEQILRNWNMQPELAHSGPHGLQKLDESLASSQPFRLILLDEQMPGMDGVEVIERIRAHPRHHGATIMVLTSANQSSSAARCRELGVESYLIKPVKPSELQNSIRRALGTLQPLPARKNTSVQAAPEQRMHILVAEDNRVNQRLAIALFERMGHRVTLANTGIEAIDLWEKGGFDFIVMDVQMPEMDGFEASRIIRSRERARGKGEHIPIVAATAHALASDRERCLEAGMDDYVSKPLSRLDLESALRRNIGGFAAAGSHRLD